MRKKSRLLKTIKIVVIIIIVILVSLFLTYKIFGLTKMPWLFGIIGPQTYTAHFDINGADWISETSLSCTTDRTFTCKVKAPEISKKGSLIIGWNYGANLEVATFIPGDEIILDSKKTKFYAITIPRIEVSKVITIDNLVVEFEEGLKYYKNIDLRINSLQKLYSRWPFIFKYREKLSFLTNESFQRFNDVNYDGANHWGQRYIDIKESNSDYTFIHELAHTLDFNCTKGLNRVTYKSFSFGNHKYDTIYNYGLTKLISESEEYDFIKLYNKYKNAASNKRPLKDYSYTNEREFFADAITYYYDYKYENQYYNLVNKEIKDAVEKLIKDINSGLICQTTINQKFNIK